MPIPTARRLSRFALLGLLLSAGCGKSVAVAEVEGTLTCKGAPLENVLVEFVPDEERGTTGPRSSGVTDAAGHFVLRCADGRVGAVVGRHRVVLAQAGRPEPAGGESRNPHRNAKAGAPSPGDTTPTVDPALLAPYRSARLTSLEQLVQPGTKTITIALP
jgi:hypothetical protein